MFGVLVVQSPNGAFGYLSAFSGKLGDEVIIDGFVPPIFNRLDDESYFLEEEFNIKAINRAVNKLQNGDKLNSWTRLLEKETLYSKKVLTELKTAIKESKAKRKIQREKSNITAEQINNLSQQSIIEQLQFKRVKRYWRDRLSYINDQVNIILNEISSLKAERKTRSNTLQKKLFSDYIFLDANGNRMPLWDIFEKTPNSIPPSGAGDCCAPKLMQYAYLNNFKPIALAEFWWGKSPGSILRKHGSYYPACKSKCEPILTFMLQGLKVDTNPMLSAPIPDGEIQTVFQDEHLLIVNKPANLLSVPGKTITDCVLNRLIELYKNDFEPLLLHRLDMATSGLMVFAKTKRAHKNLQKQFLNRTIKKRYMALLDGILKSTTGTINLPLRVDLDRRPYQMVCYEHGKASTTHYEVIAQHGEKTLVYFYPVTGRTHQLRVHAAHEKGLNTPILGDDLYGKRANRLHLHAQQISFKHPITGEKRTFETKPSF